MPVAQHKLAEINQNQRGYREQDTVDALNANFPPLHSMAHDIGPQQAIDRPCDKQADDDNYHLPKDFRPTEVIHERLPEVLAHVRAL